MEAGEVAEISEKDYLLREAVERVNAERERLGQGVPPPPITLRDLERADQPGVRAVKRDLPTFERLGRIRFGGAAPGGSRLDVGKLWRIADEFRHGPVVPSQPPASTRAASERRSREERRADLLVKCAVITTVTGLVGAITGLIVALH
jgi:hypothetical protein